MDAFERLQKELNIKQLCKEQLEEFDDIYEELFKPRGFKYVEALYYWESFVEDEELDGT